MFDQIHCRKRRNRALDGLSGQEVSQRNADAVDKLMMDAEKVMGGGFSVEQLVVTPLPGTQPLTVLVTALVVK